MTHAPYAIINDLVLAWAKTTKTACGRRQVTAKLVSRDEATCPECRAQIERDREEYREMERIAREVGLL